MLPWALGQAGHDLSGRSAFRSTSKAPVRAPGIRLSGSVRFLIPNGSRTRSIVGRAPQFALVTGKRLDPDAVLASGNVVLGGDADTADPDHPDDPRLPVAQGRSTVSLRTRLGTAPNRYL